MKLSLNKALNLASYHRKSGNIKRAEQLYNAVLKVAPANKTAKHGLRQISAERANSDEIDEAKLVALLRQHYAKSEMLQAITIANRLILNNPAQPVAWSVLGAAKLALGYHDEAEAAFAKLKTLRPNDANVCNNFAAALMGNHKYGEAIDNFYAAIKIKKDFLDAHVGLAFCLHAEDRLEEALSTIEASLKLNPVDGRVLHILGIIKLKQGKNEEAISALDQAVKSQVLSSDAHRQLSLLTKYQVGHAHIAQVEKLLSISELTHYDRCQLNYTYAKMKEDLDEFDQAFKHYCAAGTLRKQMLNYDVAKDISFFRKIKQHTLNMIAAQQHHWVIEENDTIPIFIVGMPRSGTSLVEQIISSHSDVTPGGELSLMDNGGKQLIQKGLLDIENLKVVRAHYLNNLNKLSCGSKFVTDKMPHNFRYLGIIRAAFPEAKIVHVTRDPGAVCWSNFQRYFPAADLSYSYNIADVVKYYGLYADLMKFFQKMFPNEIYEIDYDLMTCEPEEHIRALINNLTLSWQASCLSPHQNKRIVATASREQVKKEIYTGSSQRWRKFEPYLNGAFDVLYTEDGEVA